jgi:hypothetical protein
MHEALCRSSGTTLDSVHAEDGPPITQRTSGLGLCRWQAKPKFSQPPWPRLVENPGRARETPGERSPSPPSPLAEAEGGMPLCCCHGCGVPLSLFRSRAPRELFIVRNVVPEHPLAS